MNFIIIIIIMHLPCQISQGSTGNSSEKLANFGYNQSKQSKHLSVFLATYWNLLWWTSTNNKIKWMVKRAKKPHIFSLFFLLWKFIEERHFFALETHEKPIKSLYILSLKNQANLRTWFQAFLGGSLWTKWNKVKDKHE